LLGGCLNHPLAPGNRVCSTRQDRGMYIAIRVQQLCSAAFLSEPDSEHCGASPRRRPRTARPDHPREDARMRIEEVASTAKAQRVATHTHIKGLGLKDDGTAIALAAGFVGQEQVIWIRGWPAWVLGSGRNLKSPAGTRGVRSGRRHDQTKGWCAVGPFGSCGDLFGAFHWPCLCRKWQGEPCS
jgi:hypothetical protein